MERKRDPVSLMEHPCHSLTRMAREYVWLWDWRHGVSEIDIAKREGVDVKRVQEALANARAAEKGTSE